MEAAGLLEPGLVLRKGFLFREDASLSVGNIAQEWIEGRSF